MRHYGVPTRLLDWSASFYVAAYFAAASAPSKDGAVFVLHLNALDQAIAAKYGAIGAFNSATIEAETKKPDASAAIHIVGRSTALLDRMIAQQCCFMSSLNVATDSSRCSRSACPLPHQTAEYGPLGFTFPPRSNRKSCGIFER